MKKDSSPLWHPQGISQNLFLWNAGRLQGVFNHPEYTTDGKWHWLRMADISSNFCTNKLVKPLRLFLESLVPYTSDHTSLLIPVSQFPTIGFLIFFFFYSFLPLELTPCSCLPSSTLVTLFLEGSFFHKLSLHHWPLSPVAELHFFVPVLHSLGVSSSPVLEADGIDQPLCH